MPCMPFVRIASKIKYISVYRKTLTNKVFKFKRYSPIKPKTIKSYISLKLFKNYPRLCKLHSYFTKNKVKTFFCVCQFIAILANERYQFHHKFQFFTEIGSIWHYKLRYDVILYISGYVQAFPLYFSGNKCVMFDIVI